MNKYKAKKKGLGSKFGHLQANLEAFTRYCERLAEVFMSSLRLKPKLPPREIAVPRAAILVSSGKLSG